MRKKRESEIPHWLVKLAEFESSLVTNLLIDFGSAAMHEDHERLLVGCNIKPLPVHGHS